MLKAQGKHDAALDHYHKALAIRKKVLGDAHPRVADCLCNIGIVHEAKGDLQSARECWEEALSIRSSALGPDHPETKQTQKWLE